MRRELLGRIRSPGAAAKTTTTVVPRTVVGISGCSRSGKSTLASGLRRAKGGAVIHLDRYFKPGVQWDEKEESSSLDHDAILTDVVRALENDAVVVVEGFRAFFDPRLVDLMTVRLWIDVPRDVCLDRRAHGPTAVSPHYFDTYLWPRHEAYARAVFAEEKAVVRLDGTRPKDEIREDATRILAGAHAIAAVHRVLEGGRDAAVAVITLCGSLSPVTLGHVAMFEAARAALLRRYDRVLGLVTLNDQTDVDRNLKEEALPLATRHLLLHLAIRDKPWCAVEGVGFRSEGQSLPALRTAFPTCAFDHYFMNGADDVLKYPSKVAAYRRLSSSSQSQLPRRSSRMICIGRPGSTEQVRALLGKFDADPDSFLLLDDVSNEISSTDARRFLKQSTNRPREERLQRLQHMLHPAVAEWCVDNYFQDTGC